MSEKDQCLKIYTRNHHIVLRMFTTGIITINSCTFLKLGLLRSISMEGRSSRNWNRWNGQLQKASSVRFRRLWVKRRKKVERCSLKLSLRSKRILLTMKTRKGSFESRIKMMSIFTSGIRSIRGTSSRSQITTISIERASLPGTKAIRSQFIAQTTSTPPKNEQTKNNCLLMRQETVRI